MIVRVVKRATDPTTPCRVSLGAVPAPARPGVCRGGGGPVLGWYCVYRGTKEQAIAACEEALKVLRAMPGEPPVQPD